MAYDENNVFAKVLRDEIPCHKIYEDADTLAFLDIMPRAEGHALVITKEKARDLFDISPSASPSSWRWCRSSRRRSKRRWALTAS